jgi:hypothetical protein
MVWRRHYGGAEGSLMSGMQKAVVTVIGMYLAAIVLIRIFAN